MEKDNNDANMKSLMNQLMAEFHAKKQNANDMEGKDVYSPEAITEEKMNEAIEKLLDSTDNTDREDDIRPMKKYRYSSKGIASKTNKLLPHSGETLPPEQINLIITEAVNLDFYLFQVVHESLVQLLFDERYEDLSNMLSALENGRCILTDEQKTDMEGIRIRLECDTASLSDAYIEKMRYMVKSTNLNIERKGLGLVATLYYDEQIEEDIAFNLFEEALIRQDSDLEPIIFLLAGLLKAERLDELLFLERFLADHADMISDEEDFLARTIFDISGMDDNPWDPAEFPITYEREASRIAADPGIFKYNQIYAFIEHWCETNDVIDIPDLTVDIETDFCRILKDTFNEFQSIGYEDTDDMLQQETVLMDRLIHLLKHFGNCRYREKDEIADNIRQRLFTTAQTVNTSEINAMLLIFTRDYDLFTMNNPEPMQKACELIKFMYDQGEIDNDFIKGIPGILDSRSNLFKAMNELNIDRNSYILEKTDHGNGYEPMLSYLMDIEIQDFISSGYKMLTNRWSHSNYSGYEGLIRGFHELNQIYLRNNLWKMKPLKESLEDMKCISQFKASEMYLSQNESLARNEKLATITDLLIAISNTSF